MFTYLESVKSFFNGLSILYVNEQYVSVAGGVAHSVERQFKPNTYYCSGYF